MGEIVNPVASPVQTPISAPERPSSLSGQTLGVLINGKEYSDVVLERVVEGLQARYQFKDVIWWNKGFPTKPAPFLSDIISRASVVLNGVGH